MTVIREFFTKNYELLSNLHVDIHSNDEKLCITLSILNDTICINVVKS